MKTNQKKYVEFTRKMVILYCAAYLGFYAHALVGDEPVAPAPQQQPVQQKPAQQPAQPAPLKSTPTAVLGDTTQAPDSEASRSSALAEEQQPLGVEALPGEYPEVTPLPEELQLDAWWSTMEYKDRLDVSITAMEPVECEFILTTYNGYKSTIRHSVPMESETCEFETKLKSSDYTIWAKATSFDGKIREFGRK